MMICKILITIMAVCFIAMAINLWDKERTKNKSIISFKESLDLTSLPIVTFYHGDQKLHFLLDTGSDIAYIHSPIVKKIHATSVGETVKVGGFNGPEAAEGLIYNTTIHYNEQIFDLEFVDIDLSIAFDRIKQETGVTIHGILGNAFFKKYHYILDFDKLCTYIRK